MDGLWQYFLMTVGAPALRQCGGRSSREPRRDEHGTRGWTRTERGRARERESISISIAPGRSIRQRTNNPYGGALLADCWLDATAPCARRFFFFSSLNYKLNYTARNSSRRMTRPRTSLDFTFCSYPSGPPARWRKRRPNRFAGTGLRVGGCKKNGGRGEREKVDAGYCAERGCEIEASTVWSVDGKKCWTFQTDNRLRRFRHDVLKSI